jgi:GT2 family glycosyltransferase
VIHHSGIFINAHGKPEHDRSIPRVSDADRVRASTAVTAACALVRADVFRRLGGFDETFRNGHEDVDFCLSAHAAGLRCYVALDSRVDHHVSASPGRGNDKIRNAALSMNRWREVLPELASEAWLDSHLRKTWESRLAWPTRLRIAMTVRTSHQPTTPPSWLIAMVRRNISRQLNRWRRDLGGTLPAPARANHMSLATPDR